MMAAGRSAAMAIAVTAAVCPLLLGGAGQAAAEARMPAGAGAAAPGGTWHKAVQVPGTSAGDNVGVQSVSCGSAGNCSASGSFLASEVNGGWRAATGVPGIAALNGGFAPQVASVSCASAGNCGAGGHYNDSSGSLLPFVVSEVHGRWRNAIEVPGITALSAGRRLDQVVSVACASAGNCSAGGQYGGDVLQAFVVTEVNGRWGTAIEVPGTATLNKNGWAEVDSVSCASAGNCTAGGTYTDKALNTQAFVVSQTRGRWRKAEEVPGTAKLNKAGFAEVNSISCVSPGYCSAGGDYASSNAGQGEVNSQAFVVNEVDGRWDKAEEVPGSQALNTAHEASVISVSCTSRVSCSAGGDYTAMTNFSSAAYEVFVVDKTRRHRARR
jgi:hypothetical protein